MRNILILLLLMSGFTHGSSHQLVYTYHNDTDNPVKVITHYLQRTQKMLTIRGSRSIRSDKSHYTVANILHPHESKVITIIGDPLSAHHPLPDSIQVCDLKELDHAILPKYNVQRHNTFTIQRNRKGKLAIQGAQY